MMPNWGEVLSEIEDESVRLDKEFRSPVDEVRRKYLSGLNELTKRPIIAYYSGWLSNSNAPSIEITDEDKSAFMAVIHGLQKNKGLDLILHTPGGGIAAAESLVDYLYKIFGSDIRAIIPHMAMSAGTMIACACKEIVLAKHSNIGPIDPQIGGLPAAAVKKEIERALKEIKEDPDRIQYWQFILNKYHPTFIDQCEQAVQWSTDFVKKYLLLNMLKSEKNKEALVDRIIHSLSDFEQNKSHNRHIHIDECKKMGLKVIDLEDDQDLQDAVLTVHHCFMHTINVSGAGKIVENHKGVAFFKIPQRKDHTSRS